MAMSAIDIIKKFLEYAEYDPEQRSFLWGTANQQLNSKCKNIAKINAYDPSGAFAVLYAKQCFINWLTACKVSAYDAVARPEGMADERAMWEVFSSPEVIEVEDRILDAFGALLDKVANKKLLGKRDIDAERKALLVAIDAAVEALPKCNEDLFLRGGVIRPVGNFSTYIHVFERLSECLMALEQVQDGLYLCFIENYHGSLDGYFGFFLKSNGNILSINERINEAFPGEHRGHRNNRWTEQKMSELFPYGYVTSLIDPQNDDPEQTVKRDYKGYACNIFIDEEKLAFLNLEPEAYMPLIVAMLMINNRYADTSTNHMRIRYVDSLLKVNTENPKPGVKELMIPETSAIAAINHEYTLNMTSEGIRKGIYAEHLRWDFDPTRHYSEGAEFPAEENIFANLYGDGFELDTEHLLECNQHMKYLTSAELATTTETPDPEYVGSEVRMEIVAYMRGREQLARYIREKMYEEYIAFGGVQAVEDWYKRAILANRSKVYKLCIERTLLPKNHRLYRDEKAPDDIEVYYFTECRSPSETMGYSKHPIQYLFNEYIDGESHIKGLRCCITGQKASIFFVFDIANWKDICKLVGDENVPKIVKGYEKFGHHGEGNCLLSATDAVWEIGTPFESHEEQINQRYWTDWKWRNYQQDQSFFHHREIELPDNPPKRSSFTSFKFAIGFSKRGWAKVIKEMR